MSDITSRPYSKEGEDSWDRVFGNKNKKIGEVSKKCKCKVTVFYYYDCNNNKKRYCGICGKEQ